MQTITIGSWTYNLVEYPSWLGFMEGEIGRSDTVALTESPYTLQTQTQAWPGADRWDMSFTTQPLLPAQAAEWEGFLAELRGQLNVFQAADPRRLHPLGAAGPGDVPVTASIGPTNPMVAMTTLLYTTGWRANVARLLKRGDRLQIGYRYHEVCETVGSDGSGDMTIKIWPSLRETVAGGVSVVLSNPVLLLRLASNRRPASFQVTGLSRISFKAIEVR